MASEVRRNTMAFLVGGFGNERKRVEVEDSEVAVTESIDTDTQDLTVDIGEKDADALLDALLRDRGYEKRWAIAKPDGSIELVDGEDPVAAADLVPSWRAVAIYVPVQGEGE